MAQHPRGHRAGSRRSIAGCQRRRVPQGARGARQCRQCAGGGSNADRALMHLTDVRIMLGFVAAYGDYLEQAIYSFGRALSGQLKPTPSLLMVHRDLTCVLKLRYQTERLTRACLECDSRAYNEGAVGDSGNLNRDYY